MPFGFDLDEICGYYTVKYAHIRDRRLGFIQKGLMFAIFCKILGLTIVYKCNHLLNVPVIGSARANSQQPTVNGCNPMDSDCMSDFTPLSQLPYCSQFDPKASKDVEEDGKAEKGRRLSPKEPSGKCEYWDAPAMTRGRSPVPGTLFLPTRISSTKQKEGCSPDESNDYQCTTKPWVHAGGDDKSTMMIADVERFTVLINQAFSADLPGHDIQGRAADYTGFVKGRPDLIDFYTRNAKTKGFISHMEKDEKSELKAIAKLHPIPDKPDFKGDFKQIFSLAGNGDVFAVSDLLRMADMRGAALLDEVREDGTTMRSEGGVVSVEITYSNIKKLDVLGKSEPIYTVSAKFIPMKYYKIAYESFNAGDSTTRTMHNVHGLLFLFTVKGYIRVFSISNLLTVLTTAMLSLAMAATLTDYIMSYCPCLGLKDHYNILKFQPTMDFGDLQKRIDELQADARSKGVKYDPSKIKASACSQAINKFAGAPPGPGRHIEHEQMLAIICCFEQRLNRLDGMDASSENDACSEVVKKFKDEYKI